MTDILSQDDAPLLTPPGEEIPEQTNLPTPSDDVIPATPPTPKSNVLNDNDNKKGSGEDESHLVDYDDKDGEDGKEGDEQDEDVAATQVDANDNVSKGIVTKRKAEENNNKSEVTAACGEIVAPASPISKLDATINDQPESVETANTDAESGKSANSLKKQKTDADV